MSPRSEEFLGIARDAVEEARVSLGEGLYVGAASRAYYAMLNGARAALSERDLHAKTHRGTWSLFFETFVKSGALDAIWSDRASKAQRLRELGDYEAHRAGPEEVAEAVAWASEFVALIEGLTPD